MSCALVALCSCGTGVQFDAKVPPARAPRRCESAFAADIPPSMPGSQQPRVTFGGDFLTLRDVTGDDRWTPPPSGVMGVVWSNDEKRIITVTSFKGIFVDLFVWDAATGRALEAWSLPQALGQIADIAIAPDDRRLAMLAFNPDSTTTRLVSVDLLERAVTELGDAGNAYHVAYANDGQRALAQPEQGAERSTLLLPDGDRIAEAFPTLGRPNEYTIEVRSRSDGSSARRLQVRSKWLPQLRVSRDGHVLATTTGDALRAWSVDDGRPLAAIPGVTQENLELSKQGTIAIVWRAPIEIPVGTEPAKATRRDGAGGAYVALDLTTEKPLWTTDRAPHFPFDERTIVLHWGASLTTVDARSGEVRSEVARRASGATIPWLRLSPTLRRAVHDDEGSRIAVIDLERRTPVTELPPRGDLVSTSRDGSRVLRQSGVFGLRVDGERCVELAQPGEGVPIRDASFSEDNRHLFVTSWGGNLASFIALAWDAEQGHLRAALRASRDGTTFLLPGSEQVLFQSGPYDDPFQVIDIWTGREVRTVEPPKMSQVFTVGEAAPTMGSTALYNAGGATANPIASRDGRFLITTQDVAKWPLVEGGTIVQFGQSFPRGLALSADERYLASGTDNGQIHVWDVATARASAAPAHGKQITALSFSPDASLLASASLDRTVHLTDVKTGQLRASVDLSPRFDHATSVAFSSDGALLFVYTARGARARFVLSRPRPASPP
jgi:WD40 repeat protein